VACIVLLNFFRVILPSLFIPVHHPLLTHREGFSLAFRPSTTPPTVNAFNSFLLTHNWRFDWPGCNRTWSRFLPSCVPSCSGLGALLREVVCSVLPAVVWSVYGSLKLPRQPWREPSMFLPPGRLRRGLPPCGPSLLPSDFPSRESQMRLSLFPLREFSRRPLRCCLPRFLLSRIGGRFELSSEVWLCRFFTYASLWVSLRSPPPHNPVSKGFMSPKLFSTPTATLPAFSLTYRHAPRRSPDPPFLSV